RTTQYLDKAGQLAHHVAIIDHGRVTADGAPSQLKALAGRDVAEVRAHRAGDLPVLAHALAPPGSGQPRVDAITSRVTVPVAGAAPRAAPPRRALGAPAVRFTDTARRRPPREGVFPPPPAPPAEPGEAGQDGTSARPAAA